ncbi:MAG: germination protein YpeB, partial [Clostridia bacterium]|nr:germination protein YpeB [Clostridia bacterium]
MEEYKNNAVDKVEKVTGEKDNLSEVEQDLNYAIGLSMMNDGTNSVLNGAGVGMGVVPPIVPELTPERAEEVEKARADRRVELARIKAHKKAEREKAKASRLREKVRRKSELKEKRAEQRHERIMQRQKHRQQNKERNKGNGGWLAAVISLGVATLVLASVLTFTFLMPSETDNMLEASYQKSFYGTVERVDNIDLNLSKALVTQDESAMQKYLVDTAINSELAENDLQQLPLQDESKFYTTKLINQIGDYSKYLNNKLVNGENLSKEDYDNLARLYSANLTLKNALQEMMGQMGDDFSMTSVLKGGKGNAVIHGFTELQNLSAEYPELIYDGPFS